MAEKLYVVIRRVEAGEIMRVRTYDDVMAVCDNVAGAKAAAYFANENHEEFAEERNRIYFAIECALNADIYWMSDTQTPPTVMKTRPTIIELLGDQHAKTK